MSYDKSLSSFKYGNGVGSYSGSLYLNGSSASYVMIHGEIVDAKFFALKGPRGTYSQT